MARNPFNRGTPPASRAPAAGAIAFVLTLALSGCAMLGIGSPNIISIEEEWEMGRQLEAEIAQELPLSQDQVVNAYVSRIGELLVSRTGMADLPWRFYVVESDDVNAFNVPGGLVYVHTGLIAEAENAAELVSVIGHELGHGVARHGTERLSQQYGLAVLAQVVLGEDPGVIQQIVAQIAAAGTIAQFSRSQEHEADELGVRLAAEGGYDPTGMVSFLELLLELREREPGSVERFFATHPAIPERIERVQAQIAEMEENGLATDDDEFQAVRARVR